MPYLFILFLLFTSHSYAQEIPFSKPLNVTLAKKATFHHLDASGRKSIATNKQQVAITWEDNRSGKPQVYTAYKNFNQNSFGNTIQLSNSQYDAYEPGVIAIDEKRFLYAWEENRHVWLRAGNQDKLGHAVLLDNNISSHPSLSITPAGKIFAAWIQQSGPHRQVMVCEIKLSGNTILTNTPVIVEQSASPRRQSYPSITATQQGIAIGWEDREHGHTRIYTSFSMDGKTFQRKKLLNDFKAPPNAEFGRGTGATRVALASDRKNTVAATWMDKRDFLGGYDIYAAISTDAGNSYGPNEITQDMLGENQPQWHPAIAISNQGKIFVAWDDPRDDTPDIWLSYRMQTEWSEDILVEPASGEGAQSSPSITFDSQGRLHLVWVEQHGPYTKLRYAHQQ